MNELPPTSPVEPHHPLKRRMSSRWWLTLTAWILIIGLVGFIMVRVLLNPTRIKEGPAATRKLSAPAQMQARVLIGLMNSGLPMKKDDFARQIEALDSGPPTQRMAYIVVCGDVLGSDEALGRIQILRRRESGTPFTPEENQLLDALEQLYRANQAHDYRPDVLTEAQRQQIRDDLGWVGELALNPAQAPSTTVSTTLDLGPAGAVQTEAKGQPPVHNERAALIQSAQLVAGIYYGMILLGLAIGGLGFCGLMLILVFLFSRKWRSRVPTRPGNGGVYIETFALWLVSFMLLSLLASLLPVENIPVLAENSIVLSSLLTLLTLVVLVWPVVRGIPWHQVRRDLGLHTGTGWWKELLAGLAGYVISLPCFAAGVLLMVALMMLQKSGVLPGGETPPAHPIIEKLMQSSLWLKIQIVIAASVIAPLLEEITFRGLLYTHLRTATRRFGMPLSLPLSALIGGFIFAAVHPQGWVAIPPLAGLACGFSILREWRGSLLPSMVAHGIHNGLVTLMVLLIAG